MLPLPVSQDDSSRKRMHCSPRRLRLLFLVFLSCMATLALVSQFRYSPLQRVAQDDGTIQEMAEMTEPVEDMALENIVQAIRDNRLIVFSKTYCSYSMNAKRILGTYPLRHPLKVIEVDLRADQDQVKAKLKEISHRDTFPNIFVNGQTVGGFDELKRLHLNGQLQIILHENGLI